MKLFIKYIFCLLFLNCDSQIQHAEIVNYTKNNVIGDTNSLKHFFQKLDSLKEHNTKTVNIAHIGDSHIQADYFSGMLRVLLQEKFGNAGRGLIFPYKLAHTNEPTNYFSYSTTEWLGIRNVLNPNNCNLGISGVSLFSKSTNSDISIKIKNSTHCNYAFNRIELFSLETNPKNTTITNCYSKEKENSFLTTIKLKDTTHLLTLNFYNQKPIDIHGIVLKNDCTGILYHTIGVNGATYKSYNKTTLFAQQLSYLQPDLIIISLGTNESYDAKFDSLQFKNELQTFVNTIKKSCGNCCILFTTPADNFKIHKKKMIHNAKPKTVTQIINNYAKVEHYATWNLYEIMGGKGSMKTWHKLKLSTKDHVHFTRAGYELKGKLLFDALMEKYNSKNK